VSVGDVQITVLPKIEGENTRVDLVKVLVGSGWLDESFWGQSLMDDGSSLLSLFAQLYAKRLSTEISRGLPRRYVAHSDNLPTLRGRLDLDRQVGLMASGSPLLACEHDVFEVDTPVNQALKAGLSRALTLVDDPSLRFRLRNLRDLMDSISDRQIQPHDIDCIVLGRNESRIRPLLSLARLFLMSKAPQIRGSESGVRSFGLMFSMWKLFEEYALNQLNKALVKISDSEVAYYAKGQERQRHLARYLDGKSGTVEDPFQIKPDIIIYRETGGEAIPILIGDTKWKDLEEDADKKTLGVSQADAYQLFSYSNLYTKSGDRPLPLALIYPTIGDSDGKLPGQSRPDQPLGALGSSRRTFHLDCESDGALDGVPLEIFDMPLPSAP
jgi:5-methylcytosine-specific restriction enzyme subunit McrC